MSILIRAHRAVRKLSANYRSLPDFLIVGAQKAGTTSLLSYLGQHPDVTPGFNKEPRYFTSFYKHPLSVYRSNFPLQSALLPDRVTGEATPYYLFHPEVPKRVQATLPDAKIIILLRNPVDRCISHYFHEKKYGHENLSLREALKAEQFRMQDGFQELNVTGHSFSHQHYSYLSRGRYVDQLERWFRFFEKSQFKIILSEDLFEDSGLILAELEDFLDISSYDNYIFRPQNVGNYQGKLDDSTLEWLKDYYQPHNSRLSLLLERPINWT